MVNMYGKVFADSEARKFFTFLCEGLGEERQSQLGAAIREKFDEKIVTEDENVFNFYITKEEVQECFDKVMSKQNEQ